MMKIRNVALVAYDGFQLLDVTGPASVFAGASRMLARGGYEVDVLSPDGGMVASDSGVSLETRALAHYRAPSIDTLLVAGAEAPALRRVIALPSVRRVLPRLAARSRRFGSVCSGTFVLAALDLIGGRKVATHWEACAALSARHPDLRVDPAALYVVDGRVWTSAGVTTGIDLALALVEDDLGQAVAMDIARTLALPMLRGGEQPQLTPALQAQATASHRLRELVAWIGTNPCEDLSVEALAQRVQMSPRHFARAFAAETGSTPARFVEQARVASAERLLRQTRWPQQRIAERSGFRSVDALQRAFARRHGLTPQAYRDGSLDDERRRAAT
jgi:transcriptional regulator GlxA family with amidase domain